MEDIVNTITGAASTAEDMTTSSIQSAVTTLQEKVAQYESLKNKKKEEIKKKLASFQEVAVDRFSEIDKTELWDCLADITTKLNNGDDKSIKEAGKAIDKFVKKYGKKK